MAKLEPLWCKVLHLVAASSQPLGMHYIARLVQPNTKAWNVDDRALWRKTVSGLLAKGVALVATWFSDYLRLESAPELDKDPPLYPTHVKEAVTGCSPAQATADNCDPTPD